MVYFYLLTGGGGGGIVLEPGKVGLLTGLF